ncbi:MAG: hypothetical protein KJZ62_05060 [Fimbriimonadaceae bacterium]|nr:hypothetical protein [Fimbriimonadaceae bacterium]QOJ12176.1 MAG: hypothetical protein HRU74_08990 [Chthonomonadaceae bacterium]
MILTSTVAAFVAVLMPAIAEEPVICPIMGSPISADSAATDYNGVRYRYCCPGCKGTFEGDPAKALAKESNKGKVLGVSLFDPVARKPIVEKNSKASMDFGGVRYLFLSGENLTKFKASPKTYATQPKKEVLFCPVQKEVVKDYASAGGYVDFEGVRYYVCCAGCLGPLSADPAKYAAGVKDKIQTPKPMTAPKG